ncbi:MAG: hypothetical protein QXP72_04650 [Desulfurococcaceae archaeon]
MENTSMNELDFLLGRLVSISYDQSIFYRKIYEELGDRNSLEKLLRFVFEKPEDIRRVLSKYINVINSYGTFLAKAYSIALLISGLGKDGLNPITLINELYRPHHLISLYNPLVLTYLFVYHRDIYEQHILRILSDQLVMYEFNPVHHAIYLYRDHLFHVSLKYEEIVSYLYGKYGLRNNALFKNLLQDLSINTIALSFRNYIRIVSSLLELLRATLYAYMRSLESLETYSGLSENLMRRIRIIHDNYRYSFSTSINKLLDILNAMLDIEGKVFRDSLVNIVKILLDEHEIFRLSRYEILVFTYETHKFREYMDRLKEIMYDRATNLTITLDNLVSVINNVIINNEYIDLLKDILSKEEEPYLTLRKKITRLTGVLPKWIEELRSV